MLSSKVRDALEMNIKNFLFIDRSKWMIYNISDVTKKKFDEAVMDMKLHNPLLYYIELHGFYLDHFGKASLYKPRLQHKNRIKDTYLYTESYVQGKGVTRKIKYNYGELLSRIFIAGDLQDVVDERVTNYYPLSPQSKKRFGEKGVGLQDPRCWKEP